MKIYKSLFKKRHFEQGNSMELRQKDMGIYKSLFRKIYFEILWNNITIEIPWEILKFLIPLRTSHYFFLVI